MKKIVSMIVSCSLLISIFVTSSKACDQNLQYKLVVPSLKNLSFTIYNDATVYNEQGVNLSSSIRQGILQWNYSGVKYPNITFAPYPYSTNRTYTVVVLFGDYGEGPIAGCMCFTSNGTRVNPSATNYPAATRDWNYCIIRVHTDNLKVQNETAGGAIQAVGSHETGHALGLLHCEVRSHGAIMFTYSLEGYHNSPFIKVPSDKDRQLLLNLYDVIPS